MEASFVKVLQDRSTHLQYLRRIILSGTATVEQPAYTSHAYGVPTLVHEVRLPLRLPRPPQLQLDLTPVCLDSISFMRTLVLTVSDTWYPIPNIDRQPALPARIPGLTIHMSLLFSFLPCFPPDLLPSSAKSVLPK